MEALDRDAYQVYKNVIRGDNSLAQNYTKDSRVNYLAKFEHTSSSKSQMVFQSSFAYADDTLLYCIANSINEVLDLSEGLLIEAAQWYDRNLLTLNINKTQFCIFSN